MDKKRIGFEITEKKLHLSLVEKHAKGWQLVETTSFEIFTDNLSKTLSQARELVPRSFKEVVMSVPYSQVLMKEITVDSSFTPAEVYQYLLQQAENFFGKCSENWFLDFETSLIQTSHELTKRVRVIATSKTCLTQWLKFCGEHGFKIKIVDVDILALCRLAPTLEYGQSEQPVALLWHNEKEFLFIATFRGQLIYVKTAPLISSCFKENLQQILQFYHALYPHCPIAKILLIDKSMEIELNEYPLKLARLNLEMWQAPANILPCSFCSLGLAIYGN